MITRIEGKWALCGGLGVVLLLAASPLTAQESGAEVWARACGRCHRSQPTQKYDADTWRAVAVHMSLYARLTSDEEAAVTEFLMGAARPLSQESTRPEGVARLASNDPDFFPLAQPDAAELYSRNCAPCHGKGGKGDGPAAAALTPPPTDLTDPGTLGQLSDEQLLEVIAQGKGSMPRFDAMLEPEQLRAITEYVRALGKDTTSSK